MISPTVRARASAPSPAVYFRYSAPTAKPIGVDAQGLDHPILPLTVPRPCRRVAELVIELSCLRKFAAASDSDPSGPNRFAGTHPSAGSRHVFGLVASSDCLTREVRKKPPTISSL